MKVAIIIPFRKRDEQLDTFVRHYHEIWRRQQIHYRLFVVNQVCLILELMTFIHLSKFNGIYQVKIAVCSSVFDVTKRNSVY